MPPRLQTIAAEESALLSGLHRQVFAEEGWSEADWRALLGVPGAFGWLGLDEAEAPLAFLLGRHAGGEAEILTLGVLEEARGQGFGVALVAAFQAELRREGVRVAYLEVAESNRAALALYRRCGFAAVGRRDDYYKRPNGREHALVLRWADKAPND